jgi:hypothetical protein
MKNKKGKEKKRRVIPIADSRQRMTFPKRPDKYRIWVTDTGRNEPADYLATGFTFCTQEEMAKEGYVGEGYIEEGGQIESRICLNVGRAGHIDNAMAYLMEIDMDEWQEIRAQIHEERQEPIKQIIRQHEAAKRAGELYGEMNIKTM